MPGQIESNGQSEEMKERASRWQCPYSFWTPDIVIQGILKADITASQLRDLFLETFKMPVTLALLKEEELLAVLPFTAEADVVDWLEEMLNSHLPKGIRGKWSLDYQAFVLFHVEGNSCT